MNQLTLLIVLWLGIGFGIVTGVGVLNVLRGPRDLDEKKFVDSMVLVVRLLAAVLPGERPPGRPHTSVLSAASDPGPAARRLTRLSVLLIQPQYRDRYREEFASELADLAELPRSTQSAHALRTLASVWSIRMSLRAEQRQPASGGER